MELKTDVSHALGQALDQARISRSDYTTLIQALFAAAPSKPSVRLNRMQDKRGGPVANTSISRKFDGFSLSAEDRGPTYAVWIIESENANVQSKILFFAEFPWGELSPVE